MDEQAVFEKVKAIIIDKLNADEATIVPAARFREDLKADSLDLVELIMAFEEEFGGTISDDDARSSQPSARLSSICPRPALLPESRTDSHMQKPTGQPPVGF